MAACLASTGAVAASGALSADQGWTAVERCARESTERLRHACLDDLLRRAGLLTPQAEAGQQRREFGLDTAAARAAAEPPAVSARTPDAPAVAPNPATESRPAPASPPPPKPPAAAPAPAPERLEVELTSARTGNDGKVWLTTTDGAVWKQIDSDSIPRLPAAGATVKIRKATLGSYLCELPSRHTFRCQRQK